MEYVTSIFYNPISKLFSFSFFSCLFFFMETRNQLTAFEGFQNNSSTLKLEEQQEQSYIYFPFWFGPLTGKRPCKHPPYNTLPFPTSEHPSTDSRELYRWWLSAWKFAYVFVSKLKISPPFCKSIPEIIFISISLISVKLKKASSDGSEIYLWHHICFSPFYNLVWACLYPNGRAPLPQCS